MDDFVAEFNDEVISFSLEQYNQLYVGNTENFLKTMIRLKNLEGEKFDDHFQNKYKGNTYLFSQKITKSNTLVLDLNDFSKLILNLSFHKTSIIRRIYIDELLKNSSEESIISKVNELMEEFDLVNSVALEEKDISLEKMFDALYTGYVSTEIDYLKDTSIITELLLDLINRLEIKNVLLIVDSSIKFFDIKPLIDDERIIILDTNIQYNANSNNIILFNSEIDTISIHHLVEKVIFHWPVEIGKEGVLSLIQIYLHIILNDELYNLDNPSENLICLYIIIRKQLAMPLSIDSTINYRKSDEKVENFISDNLL